MRLQYLKKNINKQPVYNKYSLCLNKFFLEDHELELSKNCSKNKEEKNAKKRTKFIENLIIKEEDPKINSKELFLTSSTENINL